MSFSPLAFMISLSWLSFFLLESPFAQFWSLMLPLMDLGLALILISFEPKAIFEESSKVLCSLEISRIFDFMETFSN